MMKVLNTIFLFLLFGSVTGQQDLTTKIGSKGTDVVEAVLDRIKSHCLFRDDKLFMRRLAFYATDDGNNMVMNQGGIWKVPATSFMHTHGNGLEMEIKNYFNIDWSTTTYADLDRPLYSALAAHLILEADQDAMEADSTYQANYLNINWGLGMVKHNLINDFKAKIGTMKVSCSKAVDLVFALDESGSVGSKNFETMKMFLVNITKELPIGSNLFHFGAVTFDNGARTEFQLDDYSDKTDIENALMTIPYNGGGTRINLGIEKAEEVFKASKRKGATKALLLLTDGRSDLQKTTNAAESARNESIVIFALGIGNINDQELDAAANKPTCTHKFVIKDFNEIDSILYQIMKTTCGVSKPVSLGKESKVNVGVTLEQDYVEDTLEVKPGKDPKTTLEVTVVCAEVDLFASINTNKPNEAFYDLKSKAKEGIPAVLEINNNGMKVYVTYQGRKLNLNRCTAMAGGFNITIEEGAPKVPVIEIVCRENGQERECKPQDFQTTCGGGSLGGVGSSGSGSSSGGSSSNGVGSSSTGVGSGSSDCQGDGKRKLRSDENNPCGSKDRVYHYPNPNDAHSFIQCHEWVDRGACVIQCPAGEIWNDNQRNCDHQSGANTADTCTDNDMAAVPGKPSAYKKCAHGIWKSFSCYTGLVWNDAIKACDWPSTSKRQYNIGALLKALRGYEDEGKNDDDYDDE